MLKEKLVLSLQRAGYDTFTACEIAAIAYGVYYLELNCPDAWKTETRKCLWCGQEFKPEHVFQEYCEDSCLESAAY